MDDVTIKIKRFSHMAEIELPAYASKGSSGLDIRAAIEEPITIESGEIKLVPTGFAIEIPYGYEAQIRPRSGLAIKHGIGLVNSPGTIDSDYRGEVNIILINWGKQSFTIMPGDRIGQLVLAKVCHATIIEMPVLDETERGEGGFGHTGMK